MRIFFVGSLGSLTEDKSLSDKTLETAARDLGYGAAERGWTVLVGASTPNTADNFVITGLADYAGQHSSEKPVLEVHRPRERTEYTDVDSIVGTLQVYKHFYENQEDFQDGYYTTTVAKQRYIWASAHAGAISTADAVITLGGGLHTKRAAALASAMGIPVVAIPQSGGESAVIFQDSVSIFRQTVRQQPSLDYTAEPWSKENVNRTFDYVEFLTRPHRRDASSGEGEAISGQEHNYFLSYSHENKADCDQIELLLRRRKRNVARDETGLKSGAKLDDNIRNLISRCQTFLALFSHSYRGSDWCKQELQHARTTPKLRVIPLLVGSLASISDSDLVWRDARDWGEKERTILKVVEEENIG
jgi:hypothetical protein